MTDRAGLAALGAPPAEVSRLISEAFNEMIFGEGRERGWREGFLFRLSQPAAPMRIRPAARPID